jgi:hypothetical protein
MEHHIEKKHYCGLIFLCWGSFNRVCIGVSFFEEDRCYQVIYSNKVIKTTMKAFFSKGSNNPEAHLIQRFKPSDELTRTKWDGYLFMNMNGMIQVQETKPFAWSDSFNHEKFALTIIEKH